MTDEELAFYLCPGNATNPKVVAFVKNLTPEQRAGYETMQTVERQVVLWVEGLGPKPEGVMIDTERGTKRRRGW